MIVEFSKDRDSRARGRNGIFIPGTATVSPYGDTEHNEPMLAIYIDSACSGQNSPIMLRITAKDARKLQKAIAAAIKEAK